MSKVKAAAAILLLSLLMTLTACGNGEAKMIVGTWKPTPTTETEFLGSVSKSTWTFNADGTYKEASEMIFNGSVYKETKTGKYELNTKDHVIILKPDDGWHDDTFGDQETGVEMAKAVTGSHDGPAILGLVVTDRFSRIAKTDLIT